MQNLQEEASEWSSVATAGTFAIDNGNLFEALGGTTQPFVDLSTNFYIRSIRPAVPLLRRDSIRSDLIFFFLFRCCVLANRVEHGICLVIRPRDAVPTGEGVGVERRGHRRCIRHRQRQPLRGARWHHAALRRPLHQLLYQVRSSGCSSTPSRFDSI
jgi:hypothetical protein